MHWQKHLNQHRPQVSSWSLHQLARSNKKSHLFHYELGVHASVKSSTIFLWPHVLVLGSVITLKYNVEHPDWFCGFRTKGGHGVARLLSGGHFHADWYFWASTSFSLILERPPLSPSLVSANHLSTEQWGSSFLCYTLELGPIDIVDLKQMWMMFVYASELDQLIDQYTGNFKHQTSKCLSPIHRFLDFIHFLLPYPTCKQPRSKLICVLTEISYIWRGNLDLNKAILKQNRKRCKKSCF